MKKGFTLPMPIYHVDAFSGVPFKGNPAGVCFLTEQRGEDWMQAVAGEMNLSETAFFRPLDDENWQLRWFTPEAEVDLCGHATLATAHVIWTTDMAGIQDTLRFQTRSGLLTGRRDGAKIVLDFPAKKPVQCVAPTGLLEALGVEAVWVGENGMDLFVVVENEAVVRGASPAMGRLKELPVRGVVVTAAGDAGKDYDFVSRFFAPRVGIDEDPVTGSAHCALGPYWAEQLGRNVLMGYQASRRGGYMGVRLPEGKPGRVELIGEAITTMQGVITVEALAWKGSESSQK